MPAMATAVQLIVGLGNPGPRYETTRHNAGFWFVDALARRHGGALKPESKFHGEAGRIELGGESVWLLKPQTFMNRSGQAVAALARFYKIAPEAILVAHDELDFEPGTVRLKQGGGHGGHNGLRDIVAQLGNQKHFLRLRIGIGHPGDARLVSDYVLSKASPGDQRLIEEAIDDAVRVADKLAAGDVQQAMNRLHSR